MADERLVLTTAGGRPVTRNAKQRTSLSRTRAASPTRPTPAEELLHVMAQERKKKKKKKKKGKKKKNLNSRQFTRGKRGGK